MENKYTSEEVLELGKMLDEVLININTNISGGTNISYKSSSGFISNVSSGYVINSGDFLLPNCVLFLKDALNVCLPDEALTRMIQTAVYNIFLAAEVLSYIFREEFEDMPLGINKKRGLIYVICTWRLKIGK